jgi:ParB-like chromosome segregation protein Spo0J
VPKTLKKHKLISLAVEKCRLLERNPQFLTPRQLESLKKSIERDGFVAPILVREIVSDPGYFEIVSGNHRFMAARELGYQDVPAVLAELSDSSTKRLAVNLNLIHGQPTAEQLAPFLAELDDSVLSEIHLDGDLRKEVFAFDDILSERLRSLSDVPGLDRDSSKAPVPKVCKCPTCGKSH